MTLRLSIGIDPGVTGAVAAVADGVFAGVWDMPTIALTSGRCIDVPELARLLRKLRAEHAGAALSVWIERAWGRPGEGARNGFALGRGYGRLLGACEALGLPIQHADPQQWKRRAGLLGEPKDASREMAAFRFPNAESLLKRKKDHGRAEALLIADHGYVEDLK